MNLPNIPLKTVVSILAILGTAMMAILGFVYIMGQEKEKITEMHKRVDKVKEKTEKHSDNIHDLDKRLTRIETEIEWVRKCGRIQ
jgi:hypothetical protein